jgi:hypothetical protein
MRPWMLQAAIIGHYDFNGRGQDDGTARLVVREMSIDGPRICRRTIAELFRQIRP